MEVKIGVQYAARELTVDTDATQEEVEATVREALSSSTPVVLTDTKKRRIIVPSEKIAYVEIGGGTAGAVGFRS